MKKAKKAKEFTSFEEFKNARIKHKRMDVEIQDKYKGPMTYNQSIGFKHNDPKEKEIMEMDAYPKNKWSETKFAEAMIKTGFNFI